LRISRESGAVAVTLRFSIFLIRPLRFQIAPPSSRRGHFWLEHPDRPASPSSYARINGTKARGFQRGRENRYRLCEYSMRRTSRFDPSQHDNAPVARARARVSVARRAYTVGQYCVALSVSRAKAYDMMRSGELPFFIIGGRRHISADTVEQQIRGELPGQAQPRKRGASS
jgi:excisionase family DNA binding protein